MVVLLQLVKPGLRGDEAGHWADLTASAAAIQPAPSGYLLTLGGNGIAEVDLNNAEGLATILATMRAGLTRLVTTLRAVAPGSVVMVLTPIPRQEMSAFHTAAFVRASAMFGEVVTQCGGLVLNVVDVLTKKLVRDAGDSSPATASLPLSAFDSSGVHLSQAGGDAIAAAVRDVVLGTFPVGEPRPAPQ